MKTLIKNVTLGDYDFYIGVDREICAECFEEFPSLVEFMVNYSTDSKSDNEMLLNAVKGKQLSSLLGLNDMISDFVKFAFPKLLKKADEIKDTDNSKKADEIIEYVIENDAEEDFSNAMFNFVCLGFTLATTEQKKPKIKITVK